MAIRLLRDADIDALRSWWDTYRTQGAEYAREQGWTRTMLRAWLGNPRYVIAVDPQTTTLGLFIAEPPDTVRVETLATLGAGVAGVRAADAMLTWAWERAIGQGVTHSYGEYEFPAGVDVRTTRALRYFGSFPMGVTETRPLPDGGTYVRIVCDDLPAAIAFMRARA